MEKWLDDVRKGLGRLLADQTEGGVLSFLEEFGLDRDKMLAYLSQGTSASGKALESVVEQYFRAKRYKILERNKILKVKDELDIEEKIEIDLLMSKAKETILVECKHKKSQMTPNTLIKYVKGAIRIQKDPRIRYSPNKLLIISISGFSDKAWDKADEINEKRKDLTIELWDGDDFWDRYYPVASETERFFGDLKDTVSEWFEEEEYEEEEDW